MKGTNAEHAEVNTKLEQVYNLIPKHKRPKMPHFDLDSILGWKWVSSKRDRLEFLEFLLLDHCVGQAHEELLKERAELIFERLTGYKRQEAKK